MTPAELAKARGRLKRYADYARSGQNFPRVKIAARRAACLAERLGEITRPAACDWCLQEVPLTRHHDSYRRPTMILWLCAECHRKADRTRDRRKVG